MATLLEQAAALFGLEFKRQSDEQAAPSFAPPENDDGAAIIAAQGGFYGQFIDLEGTVRTEAELVSRYRDMSLHPEIDSAIEDITTEAIVDEDGKKTVKIVLDDLEELPPKLKDIIEEEFNNILNLLEFNNKSYDVFRRWYIDGRLYYHVMVDPENMKNGKGQYQRFQKGDIYWQPDIGSFETSGRIRNAWYELGGANGKLGYPISRITREEAGSYQKFQHGTIIWHEKRRQVEIQEYIK